jgi:serine/threonine protein kinase
MSLQDPPTTQHTSSIIALALRLVGELWLGTGQAGDMGAAASSRHPHPPHPSSASHSSTSKSFHLPCPRPPRSLASPSSFLSPSTPKLSHYYTGSIIGQGGFGKIREIKRKKDDRWFALKVFEFETMTLRDAHAIVAELLGLSRIPSHPFIIQLYAAFRERSAISFVMDLLVGGDLRLLLRSEGTMNETKIAYIIACIGSALHHIHQHQVIHRDVKPENIMFTTQGIPKLIDFGIAHLSPTSDICVCQSRSGTTQYMSPESFVPKTHYHSYESDFWSLGIVMYEMLYSIRPYETRVASPLIRYSEETYGTVWKSLLNLTISEGPQTTDHTATFPNTTTTVIPNSGNHSLPNDPAPPVSQSPVGWSVFFPIAEDESSSPLPEDLLISMPDVSSPHSASPSEACQSLLGSLLDVRIHKRCGVGENYSAFSQHAFFLSQRMDVDQILSFPSPIHTDTSRIGINLWNQFFITNLEEEVNPKPSDPFPLSKEVEDYFKEIQSVTPLFFDSNGDGTRRDMKFIGTV